VEFKKQISSKFKIIQAYFSERNMIFQLQSYTLVTRDERITP